MAIKRDAVSSFERQNTTPAKKDRTPKTKSATPTPKEKKGTSWGVIILLLFLFFPVGIWLAISKLHKETENFTKNGKNVFIIGIVFAACGIIYLTGGTDTIAAFLFFEALGAVMIWQGNSYKKLGQKYEKYHSVLVNSTDGSIDNMTSILGVNYDQAVADLNMMIGKGLFPDSYVNMDERTLVSPLLRRTFEPIAPDISNSQSDAADTPSASQVKTIKCPNCGGINTINIGDDNLCDYCGSPLE